MNLQLRYFFLSDDEVTVEIASRDRPSFAIPELLHNINMLMDNCEEDLISADRKLRHHKDRLEVLKRDEEKMSNVVEAEKEQVRFSRRQQQGLSTKYEESTIKELNFRLKRLKESWRWWRSSNLYTRISD